MAFEWDEEKNQANIFKQGISFDQAKEIFNGPILSRVDHRFEYDEVRVISIGMIEGQIVIVVIHTRRNQNTRIISARLANRKERARYREKIQETSDPGRNGAGPR